MAEYTRRTGRHAKELSEGTRTVVADQGGSFRPRWGLEMPRPFLYLNEASVDSYIGVIEGGLSDEATRRRGQKGAKSGEGGFDAKVVRGKVMGQRENSEDDERVVRDTPELRFDRLIKAVEIDPDTWNYEEVQAG